MTSPQALQMARASAGSLIIGAVLGLITIGWLVLNFDGLAVSKVDFETGSQTQADASMISIGLVLLALLVVTQAAIAFFQWRKPTRSVAIGFCILVSCGILFFILQLGMLSLVDSPAMIWLGWQIVVMVIQLALHLIGLVGIGRMHSQASPAA